MVSCALTSLDFDLVAFWLLFYKEAAGTRLGFYDYLFQFKTRLFRFKQQEIVALESQIQQKMENQRNSGVDLDSTCQICLKTKFADGIGHLCNYCNVRCCARCGGKVALRSNKVRKYSLLPNSTPWAIIRQGF